MYNIHFYFETVKQMLAKVFQPQIYHDGRIISTKNKKNAQNIQDLLHPSNGSQT